MKKYLKSVIIFTLLAVGCVLYFFYLSNKEPEKKQPQVVVDANSRELEALLTRDVDANYPESPKEVVKFYSRITQAYYKTELTDAQIETLGKQARKLFDDELLRTQTEKDFLNQLKLDIEAFRSVNRYVSDYKVDESAQVVYKTFEERKYASLNVLYLVRQDATLINSDTKYMLRQDSEGRWKILYWELDKTNESKADTN